MERYLAIVDVGVVVNIIVVDHTDQTTIDHFGGLVLPEGSPVAIGWLYDGTTFTPPPLYADITSAKTAKLAEIQTARDAAVTANAPALGYQWQADDRSVKLLNGAITLGGQGVPLPPVWRTADNINMPVSSLADLLAIASAIAAQTQAAYARSWELKAAVDAATTIQQVEAITW